MKKAVWLLCLFLTSVLFSLNNAFSLTGEKITEKPIRGRASNPVILGDGDIFFLYNTTGGGLSSASVNKFGEATSTSTFQSMNIVSSQVVKKDGDGRLWAAWVEEKENESEIYYGRINKKEPSFLSRTLIASSDTILSPSLDFDSSGNLWLAWLDYKGGEYAVKAAKIKLKDGSSAPESWRIIYSSIREASAPKIAADGLNGIWIFWAGKGEKSDDIFCLNYNGHSWSEPANLTGDNPYPDILPQAGTDRSNRVWLVWSGYDGDDYEIFCRVRESGGWSDAKKITDNSMGDLFPSLSFISDSVPVVAWSSPKRGEQSVFVSFKLDEEWSRAAEIFKKEASTVVPKLSTPDGQIALVLQCGDEIIFRKLSLAEIERRESKEVSSFSPATSEAKSGEFKPAEFKSSGIGQTPPIAYNPLLKENQYTAFGDSITYGYLDYHPAPELGYIPRLDEIMEQHFGETEIINEGWPGEVTPNGLARFDDVLAAHSSQFLLLKEGTNDIIFHEISTDTSEFDIREMVRKAKNYGVLIIVATIIPRNDWRWGKEYYKERIYELNRRIRNITESAEVPLVDFFNIFFNYPKEDGGWLSLLSSDSVHPSEKGYQLMAERWFEEIETLPFPPGDIQVERLESGSGDEKQMLNLVTWKDNVKITGMSRFSAYKIYRREITNPEEPFRLIKSKRIFKGDAAIQGSIGSPDFTSFGTRFLDLNIESDKTYEYVISLKRRDKVEGPVK